MLNYRDEITVDFKEDDVTILIQLLDHIGKKTEGSISEYIIDFCDEHSYRIEEVANLIKKNKNIKRLLKEDCIAHRIIRSKSETDRIDVW